MREIQIEEIKRSSGVIMFMTFLGLLLKNGKAEVSKKTNKAILLNSETSNLFVCGRDEAKKPYIGIQEGLIPWFLDIPWNEVAVCFEDGYFYLIATDDENNLPIFAIGLKMRRKRMLALANPKESKQNNINFKVFRIENNGELSLSYKNIKSDLNVVVVKSINDIIEREEEDTDISFEENVFVSDFRKLKMEK